MQMTEDEEALLQCCSCKSLLRDPVLLQCLHNICSQCTEKVCCAKGGSTFLVCPACNQDTDIGMEKENVFVAGQVSELEKLRNASTCSICVQVGKTDETADDWCPNCQMSMCGRCSSAHYLRYREHWPISLSEVGSISELLETSVHKCRRHGKTYDLMCWTCKIPTCRSCAEECYHSKHDVEILYTQRTWDHFERIKEKVCLIQGGLISKRNILQHCKNAISELDAAHIKDMIELQANKRAATESLDRAYKAAEAALEEHYSRLREKALELKCSIDLMEPRQGQASEYSRYLVASEDKIGLLHQETELLSGLQALVKELVEIRALQDTTRLVAIVGAMPGNLDDHTSAWIGIPRLLTDDLCCSDEVIAKLEMDVKKSLQPGDHSKSLHDENQSSDVAHELPDLGPASSAFQLPAFQTPVSCYDVAVSSDGCRLLLAAGKHGLLEYDVRGAELSRWRPMEKRRGQDEEWVTAVEAMEDGRVAVCLPESESVVLLRRRRSWQKGAAWLEDKRVTGLQIRPRHLSVHADLVAVAGNGTDSHSLLLLRLCCGQVLSRQKREYDIGSVAVTAQAVLTASWWRERVKLNDGRDVWCVVEAYGHDGQLLWRQEQGDYVLDVCAAPSGRVVFMTVCWSERVTAVRAEDGSVIRDVLTNSSHGLKIPGSLSIGGRGQQTVTAVLSGGSDWKTVTVYSAAEAAAARNSAIEGPR